MHTGSCLCGAITFTVAAPLKAADACHCSQCRKQSGHYWASTDVKRSDLAINGAAQIRWYSASPDVRRGFCDTCGSFLFWDPPQRASMAVAMGAFDKPTDTSLHSHIYVADKGDYYEIADGPPQEAQ